MRIRKSISEQATQNQLIDLNEITVLINDKPGSEFTNDEKYRDLVCKNFQRQGFSDIRLVAPSIVDATFQAPHSLSKLRTWVLYQEDPDFISPNYECLTREPHPSTTIGIRLETPERLTSSPSSTIDELETESNFFRSLWADSYCQTGIVFTDSISFLANSEQTSQGNLLSFDASAHLKSTATARPLPGAMLPAREGLKDQDSLIACDFLPALSQDQKPCLFLDRDGILNEDIGYPHRKSDFKGIDAVIPILQLARKNGYRLIVVTNQAGIAKKIFGLQDYHTFNSEIIAWLETHDLEIDAWYHCPYHKSGLSSALAKESHFRKPNPGMILNACCDYAIDLSKSFMIGDKSSDEILLTGLRSLNIEGNYSLASSTCPKFSSFDELYQFLLKALSPT